MRVDKMLRDFCWDNDCSITFSAGLFGELRVDVQFVDDRTSSISRMYVSEWFELAVVDVLKRVLTDLQDDIEKFKETETT